jgi:hypothetical protein
LTTLRQVSNKKVNLGNNFAGLLVANLNTSNACVVSSAASLDLMAHRTWNPYPTWATIQHLSPLGLNQHRAKLRTKAAPKRTGLLACGHDPMDPPTPNLRKVSPRANDLQKESYESANVQI